MPTTCSNRLDAFGQSRLDQAESVHLDFVNVTVMLELAVVSSGRLTRKQNPVLVARLASRIKYPGVFRQRVGIKAVEQVIKLNAFTNRSHAQASCQ
jgi:hypothetical protein